MIEMPKDYTPINSARTNRLRLNINLPPFVDQNRIGINLNRVYGMLQIGGIRHLKIINDDSGDLSKSTPTVVGMDQSGNAFAGFKAETSISPEYITEMGVTSESYFQARWADATIKLNLEEIARKINQDNNNNAGARSERVWAERVDCSIRGGIAKVGCKYLISGLTRRSVMNSIAQYGIMSAFEASSSHPSVEGLIMRMVVIGGTLQCLDSFFYGFEQSGAGARLSLIYGPQLDRALILKGLSLRKGLVRAF